MYARYRDTTQIHEPLPPALRAGLEDTAGVGTPELVPDAVLPEQFSGPPRGAAHRRSAVALMCAVLDDALKCYQKQFAPTTRRERRLATEAEAWLFSDEERWPFSFVNVCRALGLEPGHLRRGLKEWRQRPPAEQQRKHRSAVPAGRRLRIAA